MADFVRFAREQGIATTCRGSAPGSIVTYTLGITPVDPLHYGLPFERFLNPDRVTMPDIDVDFEDERRDEVINYVSRKYGQDHVAQIITFGTMLARAAIRDVGRVMGMGYGDVDRIAKAVPNQLGIKLSEALELSPQLKEMHDGDPQIGRLIGFAQQLEGVARNASTHAAGVVISREPLTELMPLQRATNSDALMTQYEMHGIEALGLLKFDFLGLSNLTILRKAVDLIRDHRGVSIDLDNIPLDDAKTFELLASGETTGVFQLESAGMRRYIRELQPTSVFDLAAMVALYRPGPMDNIPAYIRRKHGQERVEYLHPLLEPFLDRTYGIFVYQEDIMSAAMALGGFSGPEADMLGYAIRKKKSSVLRSMKETFVERAAERGVAPQTIDAVFKAFEPFERYGFNKAHATCYGLIAYQTAYLKANYTVDYMTSVLSAFRDNAEKVAAAIAECRRLGIEVRTPDVHRSHLGFTVEDDAIRFGLLAVKNVGEGAIQSIIDAREEGGEFRSLTDFCTPRGPAPREPQGAGVARPRRGAQLLRPPGPGPAGPGRRARRGPGRAARPGQRPDLAVRHGRRGGGDAGAPAPGRARDAGPRAPPLGEGAHGAVPLGPPDGRGRGAGRRVRDRVQRRPQGRVARRPARGPGRDRDRDPVRDDQGQGARWRSSRSRTCRGRSRSWSSPRPTRPRWAPGATARSCWSRAGWTTAATRPRCSRTPSGTGTRSRSAARRRSRARSGRWTSASAAAAWPRGRRQRRRHGERGRPATAERQRGGTGRDSRGATG